MPPWKWEVFEQLINGRRLLIEDSGPLHGPIKSFSIKRDEELELVLETVADFDPQKDVQQYPLGTVRFNSDQIRLTSYDGVWAVANGVQSSSSVHTFRQDGSSEVREIAKLHSIESTFANGCETAYVIDWLANIKDSYIWPHLSKAVSENIETQTIQTGLNDISLSSSKKLEGGHRNSVYFNVDGFDCYFCSTKTEEANHIQGPGCIIYAGNPPSCLREKIVDCISLLLGTYLVRLGHSSFDKNWDLTAFSASSPYTFGSKAFKMPPVPPAFMHQQYENGIDASIFAHQVYALFKFYDDLNMQSLSWAYWHAVFATPHIAAVHFGALIELLQRCYIKKINTAIPTKILDATDWAKLRSELKKAVTGSLIKDDVKLLFSNKIENLNALPPKNIAEEVLKTLGLKLGHREVDAWKRRNQAGHGMSYDPDDQIDLIRDQKLLQIRFWKMLFAITGASNHYKDYSSLLHPIRKLTDPVPD